MGLLFRQVLKSMRTILIISTSAHLAFDMIAIDFLILALAYWMMWVDIIFVINYIGQNESPLFYTSQQNTSESMLSSA